MERPIRTACIAARSLGGPNLLAQSAAELFAAREIACQSAS